MKTVFVIFAAALALVLQGGFAAAQANSSSGHCTAMTVTDYVSSDAAINTTSGAWVNVIDGHLNFTTSNIGCVMITFSAEAGVFTNGGSLTEAMHVRTLMDGNNLCAPATMPDIFLLSTDPAPQTANSITHVCKNVAAGAHNVQMQYRSTAGGTVQMVGHVLT